MDAGKQEIGHHMESFELLKKVKLFDGLSDDQLKIFAEKMTEEQFPPKAVIIEEGTEGSALYIVREGKVKITKTEGEVEMEIASLGAGEAFGDMSMIEGNVTSANVVSFNDVNCLAISRQFFRDIIGKHVEIAAVVQGNLNSILAERLRATSAQLAACRQELEMY